MKRDFVFHINISTIQIIKKNIIKYICYMLLLYIFICLYLFDTLLVISTKAL